MGHSDNNNNNDDTLSHTESQFRSDVSVSSVSSSFTAAFVQQHHQPRSTSQIIQIHHGVYKPKKKSNSYISSSSSVTSQRDLLPIPTDPASTIEDLDDIYAIKSMKPYRRNPVLFIIFIISSICTLGFLNLLCRWFPGLQLYLTCLPCRLRSATHMLITAKYTNMKTACKIRDLSLHMMDPETHYMEIQLFRLFEYRKATYIYDEDVGIYRKTEFTLAYPFSHIHREFGKGVDEASRQKRRIFFGRNSIEIDSKNVFALLVDEVLNPFYFFQILCIVVWGMDEYYVYAATIAIMSLASACMGLYETKKNRNRLKNMTKFHCEVVRYVGDKREVINSSDIVPGDVIEIPDGPAPCDIVLLSGQCIVNESMLTGESIPVVKTEIAPASDDVYSYSAHKNHTIFSGTIVLQKRKQRRDKVYGIACRTGYATSKGTLILSILFPKPNRFKFYKDSFKFVGVMFVVAMILFTLSSIQLFRLHVPWHEIILRALDIVTIAVPPSLPIAMTVGTAFAIDRLKKQKVYCISPPRINVSGKIQLMCFDKTGTLTEDGLDLEGIRPGNKQGFDELVQADHLYDILSGGNSAHKLLLQALASCHSLTYVGTSLVGDPLEQKIFEATKYDLMDENEESSAPATVKPPISDMELDGNVDPLEQLMNMEEVAILRRFDFRSSLQRMSVIVKDIRYKHTISFVKGSPEMIQKLCQKKTIPKNFSKTLYKYAHRGFRVLACAYKKMTHVEMRDVNHIQRIDAESDLIFLGLIVMSNKMKSVTPRIISTLNRSMIRSVMVTGDNPYTAISVAKQCGILLPDDVVHLGTWNKGDSENPIQWVNADTGATLDLNSPDVDYEQINLAVVGDVFDVLVQSQNVSLLQLVLNRSNVFARMSPSQKMQLIERYQDQNLSVGMCGDGANDCSALKTAHIGISLSDSEASIAAPFTCTRPDINCVPIVFREGKAALATSFSMFKYIAMYSLVQSVTVIILYSINSNLADWQFLFVDLGLIFPIVWLIGTTKARQSLVKESPEGTLISFRVFFSLIGHFIMAASLLVFVWVDMRFQSWFVPLVPHESNKKNLRCTEATCMFIASSFSTLSIGMAFSISKPFKKNVSSNWLYTLTLIGLFCVVSYLTLFPDPISKYIFKIVDIPATYRVRLWIYCLLHMVAAYLYEKILVIRCLGYPVHKSQFRLGKLRLQYNTV